MDAFFGDSYRCRRTELTECRTDYLTATWVLIGATLETDWEDWKKGDVTHRVKFGCAARF